MSFVFPIASTGVHPPVSGTHARNHRPGDAYLFEREVDLPAGKLSVTLKDLNKKYELTALMETPRERFNLMRVYLEEGDAALGEAFFEHLESSLKFFTPQDNISHFVRRGYSWSRYISAGLLQYLKTSASPQAKALAIVGFSGFELSEKFVAEQLERHLSEVPEATDLESAYLQLSPQFSFVSPEDSIFLRQLVLTAKDYRLFTTVEGLQLAKAAAAVEAAKHLKEKGTCTLAEWEVETVALDPHHPPRFKNLPLHTKKYRDYILHLPAASFLKLLGQVPASSSADAAIELSEKILASQGATKQALISEATTTFSSLSPVLARYEDMAFMQQIYALFMGIYTSPARVEMAAAYVLSYQSENLITQDRLMARLNAFATPRWIKPVHMADLILEKLLKLGTPTEVAKVIVGVSQENQSLTYNQWELFTEHFEIYKDLPVGWWLPLIKRASNDQ